MNRDRSSLKPIEGANRALRSRLDLKGELLLATAPTVTVLGVLALVEVLSRQRLLFASLAASAFLIYLDPQHGANSVRSLVFSQMMAAGIGWLTFVMFGPGYVAAGSAMVTTIVLMIVLDVMHPPAVATSLSFALRAGNENNLVLFALAVGITALLVGLERFALFLLARYSQS
jgi:CBS-domain-containing membrane protein